MAASIYKGGAPFVKPGLRFAKQLRFGMTGTGAPTNGTSGTGAGTSAQAAGPGSTYCDKATGNWYLNVNTALSPTWVLFASANGTVAAVSVLSANGAIDPHTAAKYVITKAGVLADTLAAPTAGAVSAGGDDGKVIKIGNSTANAHTITATGLLQTGDATTDVITFTGSAGGGVELMAYNGKFIVLSANGVTFS